MEKIKHRFLSWAIGVVSIGVLGVVGLHSEGIAEQPNPPGQQAGRFVALPNGEVLDVTTGLRWQQTPGSANVTGDGSSCNGPIPCVWQEALDYCDALGGGYRLPESKELFSLVDHSQFDPALPVGHPFGGGIDFHYWSATLVAYKPGAAWSMLINIGFIDTLIDTTDVYVWCVRSGS